MKIKFDSSKKHIPYERCRRLIPPSSNYINAKVR